MTEAKTASARWRSALTAARAPRLLGDALLALTWLLGIAFGLCAAIIALLVADGTITRWNWPGSSRLGSIVLDSVVLVPIVPGFLGALRWRRQGRSSSLLGAIGWLAALGLAVLGLLLCGFMLFLQNAELPVPIH